jgi:hypothetical protein
MKCTYCGSSNYGSGCIYSPVNAHAHMDEPENCIYCGSPNIASRCPYNPYGDNHIKGGIMYQKIKEQLKKSVMLSHIFEMVTQKNNLKYNSPLDRFYKRLAESIQKFSEPFIDSFLIREKVIFEGLQFDEKVKISKIQNDIQLNIKNLKHTIKEANMSLPTEIVERVLINAIIESCDSNQ